MAETALRRLCALVTVQATLSHSIRSPRSSYSSYSPPADHPPSGAGTTIIFGVGAILIGAAALLFYAHRRVAGTGRPSEALLPKPLLEEIPGSTGDATHDRLPPLPRMAEH
jgi:hypothetical protein